jgi:hypothetical protein
LKKKKKTSVPNAWLSNNNVIHARGVATSTGDAVAYRDTSKGKYIYNLWRAQIKDQYINYTKLWGL